ncbi:MAG: winged helix-turn-helix domain-containing protein [Pseudomonadota bacterium]
MSFPLPEWTFFSNHAHVLVCLAGNRHARLRDVAARVGITERTALRLVSQLVDAGILVREKEGRRNSYRINLDCNLRHPIEAHCTVGELLETILDEATLRELKAEAHRIDGPASADSAE